MVLGYVKGFKIPFNSTPHQNFQPDNNNLLSCNEIKHMNAAISQLLDSGAIIKCEDIKGQFLSRIFLTPKSDGTFRFILNLKALNKFIDPYHFKMEDLRTALKLLTKNCFMASIDLQEAYFAVPIHNSSKKFLRFKFQNQTYEFQCLPFGLSLAPLIFTKLMKPVASFLRNKGYLLVIYLDDILLLDNSYDRCLDCVTQTVNLLQSLGFVINDKKSNLIPRQSQTFLGFELDSQDMLVKLPDTKKNKILNKVNEILKFKPLSIRDFASFLGLLCSACPGISYGWLYTKELERQKFLALHKHNDDYDKIMSIPPCLKSDLLWWAKHIMISSNPIRKNKFTLEIFSDASLTGWGIYCNGERASGLWDTNEISDHINLLELRAAFIGLKCFAKDLTNQEILLRIDNTTAIAYINKYGGIQFPHLHEITKQIWQWCEERKIYIVASYIKSKDNIEADSESRRTNVDTEWSLSPEAFQNIVHSLGSPQIDLFASRLNTKCDRYVSWKRDPSAYNIDAFTMSWNEFFFYAFPPFSLVLRCLRKIIDDNATGIMVVPYWPSQPWYPMFVSLSCSNIIYLEPSPELLLSPFRTPHPLWKRLTLASSILSSRRFQDNPSQKVHHK